MSVSNTSATPGIPVLPPLFQYTTPALPQGRVKPETNALQGAATPTPAVTSIYDITV